jgi:thiol-disulfide isomerase/thioredoxin
MRHYLTLPLLLISSQYIFAALSPPKLPAFRFGANKNADEDDYDDEDDWDDEEWEDEGMSLALKSAVGAAIVTGAGIATKWFMNRKKGKTVKGAEVQKVQKTHSALAVDPYSPLMSMIDGHMLHRDESGTSSPITSSSCSDGYLLLVFDCDKELTEEKDQKAREDYFKLMANLTSMADSETKFYPIYIPGEGNKHIIEQESDFLPSGWFHISGSSEGLAVAAALRKKYSVKDEELRILTIDKERSVTNENALDILRVNPKGIPWAPVSARAVLGKSFLMGAEAEAKEVDLTGKKIAMYFSASWCKPCQGFTPKLIQTYDALKQRDTEVVFVSLDQDEAAFDKYRGEMPWLSLPFKDARRAMLQIGSQVKAIPALVFLDENGYILTSSGVSEVSNDAELAKFPFANDIVDLSVGSNIEKLQRGAALIALVEDCSSATKDTLRAALERAHQKEELLIPRSTRQDLSYCILAEKGHMSSAIRSLCAVPIEKSKGKPTLLIINLSDEEFVLRSIAGEKNMESDIRKLVTDYTNFEVEMSRITVQPTGAEQSE